MDFVFNFDLAENDISDEQKFTGTMKPSSPKKDQGCEIAPPSFEVTSFHSESVLSKIQTKIIMLANQQMKILDTNALEQLLLTDSEFTDVVDSSNSLSKIISSSDLVEGVYEGGLKVWECGIDLANYLSSDTKISDHIQGKSVLEVGCGAGVPGIQCVMAGAARVDFQDYLCQRTRYYSTNSRTKLCSMLYWDLSVDTYIPSEEINDLIITGPFSFCEALVLHYFREAPSWKLCRSVDFANGVELPDRQQNAEVLQLLTQPNVLNNTKKLTESPVVISECQCHYYAGDWSSFVELDSLVNVKYDVILSAETIYSVANYAKLHTVFDKLLSDDGTIFVAAKSYYFGVGGSVEAFIDFVKHQQCFEIQIVHTSTKGVLRNILRLERQHNRIHCT